MRRKDRVRLTLVHIYRSVFLPPVRAGAGTDERATPVNDGNNIFDEYVKVTFLNGIPCLSVVNTSYCPQGNLITVDNITNNLTVVLAVAKELKSKHNDCAALFLSALTEKAGVLDARQMLGLVNELYGTNI